MSVGDIRAHVAQLYGVEVSGNLISKATDAVTEEITDWQNRPLDPGWFQLVRVTPSRDCTNPIISSWMWALAGSGKRRLWR